MYWASVIVATCGTILWVYLYQSNGWHTGLSSALWLTILGCLIVYLGIALLSEEGWYLVVILFPYLFILGILAIILEQKSDLSIVSGAPIIWIGVHILLSIVTYALLTLSAIASLAAMLQERSIRLMTRTQISRVLPSIVASERIMVKLLFLCGFILLIGLATGMAIQFFNSGEIIRYDHKTVLTLAALIIIGFILLVHFYTGIRGRNAMRGVMLAYLLLTMGYPGVKFVTEVMLSS